MGLKKRGNSNITYLQTFGGVICRTSKEPLEGFTLKTVEHDGKEYSKYTDDYEVLEGHLTSLRFRKTTVDGKKMAQWNIGITDHEDGRIYVLGIDSKSLPARTFLKCVERIDFSLPISMSIFKEKGSKKRTAMVVKQEGEVIRALYKKDDLNGMPSAKIKADKSFDFSDQEDFLYQIGISIGLQLHALNSPEILEDSEESEDVEESVDFVESEKKGSKMGKNSKTPITDELLNE
jgi:hypothetical protein